MGLHEQISDLGQTAKTAARRLVRYTSDQRNGALRAIAAEIEAERQFIIDANGKDVAAAVEAGLSPALTDRLTLTQQRVDAMVSGIRQVADLPDPLARVLERIERPNGLVIDKCPVPIGVITIIYESRPNVTADAAVLCIKSGNAVILRGGKEAINSNMAIAAAMANGIRKAGLPEGTVQIVSTTDRAAVTELVQMDRFVDLVIPRGGESLIRAVMRDARVPVLKHYNGICHIFVDESADQDSALDIIHNAKCQRPGTCNAVETILVHRSIAATFMPRLAKACRDWGVAVRADESACAMADGFKPATDADFLNEYLSLEMSLAVVDDVNAAIEHINFYGSHHSDAILTSDKENADVFTREVDSAAVYVNASTRFTDGGEFGMGCEMGISTDKLHARGPVGIRELTTYKYVVHGNGQIRK